MKLIITFIALSILAFPVIAQDEAYFKIEKVKLKEVNVLKNFDDPIKPNGKPQVRPPSDFPLPTGGGVPGGAGTGIGEVITVANEIIALGERVYALVDKGRPVAETEYTPISVLPKGSDGRIADILDTENWSYPKTKKYQLAFLNGFNQEVITLNYAINYSYGGQYEGKGAYLTGVQIVPEFVKVDWGFKFNAYFKLVAITNHGSKEDPVAGATLMISYQVTNVFTNLQENVTYHIDGNGSLREL